MSQITAKICIIGDFAVGKTSTVERFVNNQFSDKYLTTIGVKVDTKELVLPDDLTLKLVLWDVAGTDRFSHIEFAYLRGASGYIVVADGTRGDTVTAAKNLVEQSVQRYGDLPLVFLLNKADLRDTWEIAASDVDALRCELGDVFETSAKTGHNVEEAILKLGQMIAARAIAQGQ